MIGSPVVPPAARLPPPLWLAGTFFAAFVLQRGIVGSAASSSPRLRALGIGLVGLGTTLALWAFGLFMRHRTTVIHHHVATTLVLRGPYRFTRNPMYVSLLVVYLGATVWTRTWMALALLPGPLLLLQRVYIPMEESRLHERFGESYVTYCRSVRRWI